MKKLLQQDNKNDSDDDDDDDVDDNDEVAWQLLVPFVWKSAI